MSAIFTAKSRLASSMTIIGSLPPNSRVTLLISRPATSITCLPISVEPVKAMRRTRGFFSNSSPTVLPGPVTTLTTPLGKVFCCFPSPYVAFWICSIQSRVASGVVEAGLMIIVFPAAKAGPSFVPISVRGKFQGTIPAHTPMGCRTTIP